MSRYILRSFIYRNVVYLSVVMLAGSFFAYGIIYKALSTKLAMSFQGAFFQMKAVHEGIEMVVWFAVALYGIVTWTCVLAICLFATHKVAGPLFRLESMIHKAKEGDFPASFVFREGDQIAPLARVQSGLLTFLGRTEERLGLLADQVDRLSGEIRQAVFERKDPGARIEDLENVLDQISDLKNGTAGGEGA